MKFRQLINLLEGAHLTYVPSVLGGNNCILIAIKIITNCHKAGFLSDDKCQFVNILGRLPKTADGFQFGMSANVYIKIDGKAISAGVLGIQSPDSGHEDDYEDGKRWLITLMDEDGEEWEVWDGDCYSTMEAAEKAIKKGG